MERQHHKPDWQAPALLSFCLSTCKARTIGRHAFYNNLDGSSVSSGSYQFAGWPVSQQQVDITIGTAFAFLANSCLTTAIGTAYVQICQRDVRGRAVDLSTLDALFAGQSGAWTFLTRWYLFRYSMLALLTLIIL